MGKNVSPPRGLPPSGDINDIVYELKMEIGELRQRIDLLEETVAQEQKEKYEAYERIAELIREST